jgi:hypothetical protein
MHLLGVAPLVLPAWEPEQGWRVLTPDCQQVSAGGISYARATFDLAARLGVDPDELRFLQEIARQENRR